MVRNGVDAFEHPKRPCKARPQLAPSLGVQRLHRPVEEAQPDPVADGELQVAMVSIVVLLGELLCLEETLTQLGQHLVTAAQEPISRLGLGSLGRVGQEMGGGGRR
jgi:hypothetical protein